MRPNPEHPHDAAITRIVEEITSTGARPQQLAVIKALRLETQLGLKDAKDRVDDYAARHPEAELSGAAGSPAGALLACSIVMATVALVLIGIAFALNGLFRFDTWSRATAAAFAGGAAAASALWLLIGMARRRR